MLCEIGICDLLRNEMLRFACSEMLRNEMLRNEMLRFACSEMLRNEMLRFACSGELIGL